MRILVIDNFDSFTYNLVQMLGGLGAEVTVRRNNVSLQELVGLNPDRLVISPGPGRPPDDTGVVCEAILHFAGKIPILGVCDTNNYTKDVTRVIPGNNKSAKSLGIILYLLTKLYACKFRYFFPQ